MLNFNIIIKYLYIYLCFFYIYYHLLNQKIRSLNLYLITFCYASFLSLFTCFLRFIYPSLTNVLPIILLWISLGILFTTPKLTFMATIISFSISYGMFVICNFIILLLFSSFCYFRSSYSRSIALVLSGCIEMFFLLLLFKIKRFRKGMPFLVSEKFTNIGIIICVRS